MLHQSRVSQSSRVSDDTPTLIGSNSVSSLDETPPLSPFSFDFPHHPHPSSTQQLALPDALHAQLENSHEAWWSRSTGSDLSNLASALSLGPQNELTEHLAPCDKPNLASYHFPRPRGTASHSLAHLDHASETKEDPPFEPSDILFHTPEPTNPVGMLEPRHEVDFELPAEHPRPSISLQLEWDPDLAQPSSVDVSVTPPSPEMGVTNAHRSSLPVFSQPMLGPLSTEEYLPYAETHFTNYLYEPSRPNSSMLAHCDQHSLSPPCQTLTQTQSGRSTLRQAGVPHGSPRALAPPVPIENIPPKSTRSLAPNFLQKLVHKTFAKSPPGIRCASYPTAAATSSGPLPGGRNMRRPLLTRHSMSFAFVRARTLASERESVPSPPKKSRWWTIQRFIAKPGTAARGIAEDIHTYEPDANSTRRGVHGFVDGRSSCLSFFGDPITRVDPFARVGLGATISELDSPERDEHPLSPTIHQRAQHIVPPHPPTFILAGDVFDRET